ncbi:MAG: Ig-like domain-containing protein [Burkholderiaceae bacterium]|nr:Ig-like domain-containing protein [Burkholderiaceae bacterium]
MPTMQIRPLLAALVFAASTPLALATGVSVRFDAGDMAGAPFPSNRHTVFDGTQRTLRRVQLPKPDCAVRPSDCIDIDVINQLDGFSTQPRITVPFTGDIDPTTVNSDTIYLVNLGDTLTLRGYGQRVGINQVVWDPATKTLVLQSDALLEQHSRYLLVITDGVRDTRGKKIKSGGWGDEFGLAFGRDRDGAEYRHELRSAVQSQRQAAHKLVAASVFTTQSISADLVKINHQIKRSTPAPVNFDIGLSAGQPVRALFPVATLQGIQFVRQTGSAPSFTSGFVPTPALGIEPGAVAKVAFGRFRSPDYQTAAKVIPATGTLTGQPLPQGANDLIVQIFLPAGSRPAGGWPVAMFGHGFTDSMYGAPWTVAASLARQGIATVSLNVVGHGGGALGTLNVLQSGALPVVVPAGGRGIDQDGNGSIDSTEGVNAAPPQAIVGSRDGLRQTVVDYMQLVRQIEAGVDVDGDGAPDLDARRLYYAGQSFGGIYGTILIGAEPGIRAGVPNVPGGSITEIARISPNFRILTGLALATRVPSLLNLPPTPALPVPLNFNENMPLRDQPPLVNDVPGALDIAAFVDRAQWVTQAGNPVSYAPFIRKSPLAGQAAKPVIVQFAKGDVTVPNPTSSAIVRAGGLTDRVTYFRNDLAYALNPAVGKNPHVFLTNIGNAAAAGFAVAAQRQIAAFFASHGATVIDPDGAGPFFELPIAGPLPEGLNFIP